MLNNQALNVRMELWEPVEAVTDGSRVAQRRGQCSPSFMGSQHRDTLLSGSALGAHPFRELCVFQSVVVRKAKQCTVTRQGKICQIP